MAAALINNLSDVKSESTGKTVLPFNDNIKKLCRLVQALE